MTTLISKDEELSLELHAAKSFLLDDGDRLIIANQGTIDKAGEWMGMHGVSQVYFNPEDDTEDFNEFMFVESWGSTAIRIYNK